MLGSLNPRIIVVFCLRQDLRFVDYIWWTWSWTFIVLTNVEWRKLLRKFLLTLMTKGSTVSPFSPLSSVLYLPVLPIVAWFGLDNVFMFVMANCGCQLDTSQEREAQLRNCLLHCPADVDVGYLLLIIDVVESGPPLAVPSIDKWAYLCKKGSLTYELRIKPVNSLPLGTLLQFLIPGSFLEFLPLFSLGIYSNP